MSDPENIRVPKAHPTPLVRTGTPSGRHNPTPCLCGCCDVPTFLPLAPCSSAQSRDLLNDLSRPPTFAFFPFRPRPTIFSPRIRDERHDSSVDTGQLHRTPFHSNLICRDDGPACITGQYPGTEYEEPSTRHGMRGARYHSIPPAEKEDELIAVLEDLPRGSLRPHNGVAIFGSGNQAHKKPGSKAGLRTRPTSLWVARFSRWSRTATPGNGRGSVVGDGASPPSPPLFRHGTGRPGPKDPPHPAGRVRAGLPFLPSMSLELPVPSCAGQTATSPFALHILVPNTDGSRSARSFPWKYNTNRHLTGIRAEDHRACPSAQPYGPGSLKRADSR